ncbi:hypothetical protein J3F84DRAFT_386927 [Trichoderma pleuroticola]
MTQCLKSDDAKECNRTKLIFQQKDSYNFMRMSEHHYISNMGISLAASHQDVELAQLSRIRALAMHQNIQTRLRNKINAKLPVEYDVANLKALLTVLAAYMSEILRIYPPIFQLTNRLTLAPTTVRDILILVGFYTS